MFVIGLKILKQCSWCHSACALEHFENNRKGEWFSTCNHCRNNRKESRDTNKDKIKLPYEKNNVEILKTLKAYKEATNPWVTCPICQK